MKMLLTEYDEVKTMRQFKEEGRAEGRAEGRSETKEEDARIIANTFNIPIETVTAVLREKSEQYRAQ